MQGYVGRGGACRGMRRGEGHAGVCREGRGMQGYAERGGACREARG